MAATVAIAELAKQSPNFGPQAIIPSPLDPRLLWTVAPAVLKVWIHTLQNTRTHTREYGLLIITRAHVCIMIRKESHPRTRSYSNLYSSGSRCLCSPSSGPCMSLLLGLQLYYIDCTDCIHSHTTH